MRIAYLILAHRDPDHLCRLVSRLGPEPLVFVHVDARADVESFAVVRTQFPGCSFVPRHRCYWGGFGIVGATLECVRALVRSRETYDYAVLLSGQDYPLRTPAQIGAFLARQEGAEFIEAFPLERPNRWTRQAGAFQATRRVRRYHLWYRSRRLSLPVGRRFPKDLVPHGGSQWWCLSRPCVEYVEQLSRTRPDVVRYFGHVFIPDEAYFQTVVANSPFAPNVVPDDLRFALWDRPDPPYPAILEIGDIDALGASRKLFARKFAGIGAGAVLDAIDRRILHVSEERSTASGPSRTSDDASTSRPSWTST